MGTGAVGAGALGLWNGATRAGVAAGGGGTGRTGAGWAGTVEAWDARVARAGAAGVSLCIACRPVYVHVYRLALMPPLKSCTAVELLHVVDTGPKRL